MSKAKALGGLIRQGDVLLVPMSRLPEGAHPAHLGAEAGQKAVVLAEGEATGHAHVIRSHRARLFRWQEVPPRRYRHGGSPVLRFLRVSGSEPVVLSHEEHDAISLQPGVYEVRRQREYEPPSAAGRRSSRWVSD
jgi:hypothetical protein